MVKFIWHNRLSSVLLFLLVISGLLNFRLFKERIEIFRKLNYLSLDPVDINRFPREDRATLESNKPKVVFFGDSRAAGWKNPDLEGIEFINRGISGETSAQTVLRFDDHVGYLSPNVIILQVGANDLRMIPYPAKTRQEIIQNCQNNIKRVVEKSQKIGAKIIVTTIFPLGKGKIPLNLKWIWPEIDEIEQGIIEVNNYIRSLEQKPNVIVFDAYELLEKQGKVEDSYAKDLLHLNRQGYEKLNQELQRTLVNVNH